MRIQTKQQQKRSIRFGKIEARNLAYKKYKGVKNRKAKEHKYIPTLRKFKINRSDKSCISYLALHRRIKSSFGANITLAELMKELRRNIFMELNIPKYRFFRKKFFKFDHKKKIRKYLSEAIVITPSGLEFLIGKVIPKFIGKYPKRRDANPKTILRKKGA